MNSELYRWLVFVVLCVVVGGWLVGCIALIVYVSIPHNKRGTK